MFSPVRKTWVGGNWKCNGTKAANASLIEALNESKHAPTATDVVIFPTALHVADCVAKFGSHYQVGSQNVSASKNGAFTGEVSAEMLKDFGLEWTLIGHSERRTLYGETDEITAKKMEIAQANGLKVSFCIGETLEEREAGKTDEVCARQIKAVLEVTKNWADVVIAYEPVWAIGTGKVATPEQAQEAHKNIRQFLTANAPAGVADSVRIVYGGSVNEDNCNTLIGMPDIDGFLVGGASLKPTFTKVIAACC